MLDDGTGTAAGRLELRFQSPSTYGEPWADDPLDVEDCVNVFEICHRQTLIENVSPITSALILEINWLVFDLDHEVV